MIFHELSKMLGEMTNNVKQYLGFIKNYRRNILFISNLFFALFELCLIAFLFKLL
jgi:hypothetical protein